MSRTKSAAELRVENRMLRQAGWVQALASVVNTAVRMGAWVLIAYFFYRSVVALSGEMTVADFGVRVLADVRISTAVAWVFALCGLGYGSWERRVRKTTVERLALRNRELERRLDPGRTSSGLTPRGDAPTGD